YPLHHHPRHLPPVSELVSPRVPVGPSPRRSDDDHPPEPHSLDLPSPPLQILIQIRQPLPAHLKNHRLSDTRPSESPPYLDHVPLLHVLEPLPPNHIHLPPKPRIQIGRAHV